MIAVKNVLTCTAAIMNEFKFVKFDSYNKIINIVSVVVRTRKRGTIIVKSMDIIRRVLMNLTE